MTNNITCLGRLIQVCVLYLLIVIGLQSCQYIANVSSQPNVIIVITDDQGYGDLSVHGNPVLKTPVLDELYNQSIRFIDFHTAPMCTPTRGQLITGRDALDNGATKVCMGRSMIREELPTMPEIFKASGYKTAHFGKWHLGDSYPHRPQDRGFEETVYHGAWGIGSIADYYGNSYWNDTYRHNNNLEAYEGYCTDIWFDLTIEYINNWKKGDKPFFIYLATNCPHGPHLCDNIYSDPYLEDGLDFKLAKFFGQISNIDQNMDRLLKALEVNNLSENTILIFMTDNGTVMGHELYNAGMRGHKTEPYEGGHRVPFFIRWPNGNLGNPRDIDILTQCQDILPTLIELCDLEVSDDITFDGKSLLPAFHNNCDALKERILVVEYENPYRPEENRVVMWKNWRLVMDKELYDLTTDPEQKNNITEQHQDVVKYMFSYYQNWKKNTLPDYQKKRYIHLGNENQNPLLLYSSDWQGSYADSKGNLFAGDRIGYWDVVVETSGLYEFTLYRWHPASGIPLTGSMENRNGELNGIIPIKEARLRIGNFDQTKSIEKDQKEVSFSVELTAGIYTLETWFQDINGNPLCSAYYTNVEL